MVQICAPLVPIFLYLVPDNFFLTEALIILVRPIENQLRLNNQQR